MKKWLRIFPVFLFTVFWWTIPTVAAEENNIQSIQIEVMLHEDGSATIHETRKMETYEHTELYIVLENLQGTDLMDFEVAGFTEEENWAIDASFEEKAGKYGVIDTDVGYELAWGITEYGTPEYTVTYTLSNMVRELEDGQALFWNFDSFLSLRTEQMQLEISAPFPLEEVLLDYYGFGFEAPIGIADGTLEWAGDNLDETNEVIVLAQFPKNTFQTSLHQDLTLEEQRVLATEGSSYNEEPPMPTWAKVLIGSIVTLMGGGAITAGTLAFKVNQQKKERNHFNPMEVIRENKNKVAKYPPKLTGDMGRYAYLISKLSTEGGGFAEYFFAYLLKWSTEGKVQIETTERERFLVGPKTEATLFIKNLEDERNINILSFSEYVELFEIGEATLEEVMWAILLEAAEYRSKLDGKAFEAWSKKNAKDVAEFYEMVDEVSKDWLVQNGYMELETFAYLKMTITIERLTDRGQQVASELVQFDNFLKEIDETSLVNYENWQEFIIWAALLGRAEDTIESLEEYHPDQWGILMNDYGYLYGNYYGYYYFYTSQTNGFTSAGYGASGGGGMSSAGGGGGAAGGGGGGSR